MALNHWHVLQQCYNLPLNVEVKLAYNNLPFNVEVKLAYYGMNIFQVVGFQAVNSFEQLPPFHTRCFRENESKCFEIRLWGSHFKKNNPVKYTSINFNYYQLFLIHFLFFKKNILYLFLIIFRVNYPPLPSKMLELQSPPLLC